VIGIEEVLITGALQRRDSRLPDHLAESRALAALMHEMSRSPATVQRRLVEMVLNVCRADSAGISLLEADGPNEFFRWTAIAGALAENLNGTIPRAASPCNVVLGCDEVLLFDRVERRFPHLAAVRPPVFETLLAPFHLGGRPIGTVWAIKHSPEGHFDGEDARLLRILAGAASAAHQMVVALEASKANEHELARRLEERTAALRALNESLERQVEERTAALRESEERFRALATASSDIVYRMSADWSERRELQGRDFIAGALEPSRCWLEDHIHPDDRPQVAQAIENAVRNRKPFELEHRVRRVDGTFGWTFSRAIPILDDQGRVLEWFGMARDVTRRKRAEEAIAQQRRLYEAILTNTPDLAYVFDLDHRFIYANEGLLRMWGKAWDEAIGKNCLELGYEPWHAAMHDQEIEQVVTTRRPVRGEVPFTGTFGTRIYDYLFVPVLGADGSVEAVAGTTRDVTERKRAEQALQEADRRKDEFLATLAHELRNPLAPIRNAVHLLKLPDLSEPQARRARDMIERQLRHMVRLVDDLLDISRITRGQINLRFDTLDLGDVLDEAVEAARPVVEAAGHHLDVQRPDEPLLLEGDSTRLSQVFQNLLDNAAKYTPKGGQIALTAKRRGPEALVSVRDTGTGIPPEMQSLIFELFTRLHPDEDMKVSGLGIGLALARQLVGLHGGKIEVKSNGAGTGSEFIVHLPVFRGAAAASSPAADESSESSTAG
jgi:two-component system CheB/CheR fusion protein